MKAYIFLAQGFEEIEAITVLDYLRRAGVETLSVKIPDTNDGLKVEGAHKITVYADILLNEILAGTLPDLIYVPGGMPGSTNCASCKELLEYIVKCYENGKHVSALCAAPAVVLSKTLILKGKNWTCYPSMEESVEPEDVEESVHVENVPFVTDGNITTGRGPGTAEQFAMELVRILCGDEIQSKIKKSSIQRD